MRGLGQGQQPPTSTTPVHTYPICLSELSCVSLLVLQQRSQCPFDFMENLSLEGKTNFFEKRVDSYALATKTVSADTFDFGEDF